MLFKWHYNERPGCGRPDLLKLGNVTIGEVSQARPDCWRAICLLPDSSDWDKNFIDEFSSKGFASNALVMCCAYWLSKAGVWTLLHEPDSVRFSLAQTPEAKDQRITPRTPVSGWV